MTKTLTEQFLFGQLLDGYWYINNDGHEDILEVEKGKYYLGGVLVSRAFMGDKIDKIECLAPVPSYDEYKRLVSKTDELPTEQVLNLQKMVEDECSRRCELETKCSQLEKRLEVSEKEHYRTLEQLRIATGALKKLKNPEKDYLDYIIDKDGNKIDLRSIKIAAKALKEMEGVK